MRSPFESPRSSVFISARVREEPILLAPRKTTASGCRLFRGAEQFVAAVPHEIVTRLVAFAKKAAPDECIGLLVGKLAEDDEGRYVILLGVVPDNEAIASRASVRTTVETELRTRLAAEALYPDGVVLGWWHSHPGYGARYSAEDHRNQATWTASHSLGIVVDPTDPETIAVYRGPSAELLRPLLGDGEPKSDPTPRDGRARRPARSKPSCRAPIATVLAMLWFGGVAIAAVAASFTFSRWETTEARASQAQIALRLEAVERQLEMPLGDFLLTELVLAEEPVRPEQLVCDDATSSAEE